MHYVILQLEDHEDECPSMEKTCPLSGMIWNDDLDKMLNDETLKSSLKIKWNDALGECKGTKVSYNLTCICYSLL